MKKNSLLFLLIILFLISGCAAATDLHVMTDDLLGVTDDLAKDEPKMVIYDEAAYNANNVSVDTVVPTQSAANSEK